MILHFDPNLAYQQTAVKSIIDLFEGQLLAFSERLRMHGYT
ncbi:hypothetical protein HMPREF9726_01894 [Treponema denticola H-22]|uniref:Uncharacterized protein n=1 Tax=Treponema denticola H-22 TaxID=999432 RepID=A0A0E2EFA0_TREDN|nr:hypothetical protein HMPREF9726_01894 [Treponema denticola H-22]